MKKFRSGARRAIVAALLATGLAGTAFGTAPAAAQAFPARALKLVVPYPAGTPGDEGVRILAAEMQASLGQQVGVDNRPGADGATAVEAVARSAPDGYTLGIGGAGPLILLPTLDPRLPYQPLKDLAVVGVATTTELVFVARPALPVKSLPDLIAHAQANPGKVKYATPGARGLTHVAFELLQSMARISLVHAPARDEAAALDDLLAGRADVGLVPSAAALPSVKSGKLTALATAGTRRSKQWPDLPTASEARLPGYAASAWTLLVAPAATPPGNVTRLNAALNAALRNPAVAEKLLKLGLVPAPLAVGQTRDYFAAETAKWSRIAKEAILKEPQPLRGK